MSEWRKTFRVRELPDAEYVPYRVVAGGDVCAAISRDCEHWLRILAQLPAATAAAEVRFVYQPSERREALQSRIRIYVRLWARSESVGSLLKSFVTSGPLARFYEFVEESEATVPWDRMRGICDVVRHAQLVRPLHGPEFNANIPEFYYSIEALEPNDDNDYSMLDRVLGNLTERVVVCVAVESADVSEELAAHTDYLRRLEAVNRHWDQDDEEDQAGLDYVGDDSPRPYAFRSGLRPLRHKDPLADNILRQQQRFHDSLRTAHLYFGARVFAESGAVARMVGSVLGESGFCDGSYRLITIERGDPCFDDTVAAATGVGVHAIPAQERLWKGKDAPRYERLRRLIHVAPVEELAGLFRLPVAGHASPCCIRKNTDPVREDIDDLIVFGRDLEPSTGGKTGSLPRGIRFDLLLKHCFIAGTPGTGKTTAMMHLLLQLAGIDLFAGVEEE